MAEPTRPLVKMHESISHVLDAGQHRLESLACLGKRLAYRGFDSKLLKSDLFEFLSGEQLTKGHDENMRVELLRAKRATPGCSPHPRDGEACHLVPELSLRYGDRVWIVGWRPSIGWSVRHARIIAYLADAAGLGRVSRWRQRDLDAASR